MTCGSTSNSIVRANLDGSHPVGLGNLNGMGDYTSGIALDTRVYLNLPLVVR